MGRTSPNKATLRQFFTAFLKFLRTDFSVRKHVPVYVFAGAMIFALYFFDFDHWKKSLEYSPAQNMVFLMFLYSASFFIPLFWVLYAAKHTSDKRGYGIALLYIGLFAFTSSWSPYHQFAFFRETEFYYWNRKILSNTTPMVVFVLAMWLTWKPMFSGSGRFLWIKGDVNGFRIVAPLLIVVVILVLAGSQLGDFGSDYPVFRYRRAAGEGVLPALQIMSFELAYGLDFYVIELLFRGVLVLGLLRYFGPHVLLPMASFYVFVHYGKPMAETISSFFGAYVLGYLAIYTRSVLPGTLLHVTLAWTMELTAVVILGNY